MESQIQLSIDHQFEYNLNHMAKKSLQEVKKQFQQLNFDPQLIQIAYANVDGDSGRIMDQIFRLQAQSQSFPTKPANAMDQERELGKIIEMSMNQAKSNNHSFDFSPEQKIRKSGVPVGLKNVGNTCYFNSLLQTYFQNVNFVKEILSYEIPKKYVGIKDEQIQKFIQDDFDFKRKFASCKLVENLKILFSELIASDKKYVDPKAVITSIVDDYGNELAVGDQKDIGEFNLIFLSRIEDGLEENRKERQMAVEKKKEEDKEQELQGMSLSKINSSFGGEDSSILRRSSIRINEQSIIADQFLGKIEHTFLNEKQNIHKTEEELFSLLFVNVKYRQLYNACEEITITHIDDYRNEKGEVIGVQKHSWIKEPPKTLFFQIDRVTYDKQSLALHKINDLFDFPEIFYIDPFLLKNKDIALKLQKSVKSLRQEKAKYLQALESIYKYGQNQFNLLSMLSETEKFFINQQNQMETQKEVDNPLNISHLSKRIKPDFLDVLKTFKVEIGQRIDRYKARIEQIEKAIEKAYKEINRTPYHLYSLLIHEGSADSGHYYSYLYDHQINKWRKYNDLNITEEAQPQVLKEGKGINVTSAYYLVYAQKEVLLPSGLEMPKASFTLSTQESYMKDLYSSFLKKQQRNAVITDNNHLYYEIEEKKMNSNATRVVDVYAKKFENFNEIFRKTKDVKDVKEKKKKHQAPLLTSLPVFVKSLDEDQYKNLLLQHAIEEHGPKQYSAIFEDLLKKKLGNFHEFKKPKKFQAHEKYFKTYINNYQFAIAAKKVFESIEKEEYSSIFTLFKRMLQSDMQNYFNWLSRTFLKIFIVLFMVESQRHIKEKPDLAIERLKMVTILFNSYVKKEDERMLHINVIVWINQLLEANEHLKKPLEEILQFIDKSSYEAQYCQIENQNQNQFVQIDKSIDLADALWNSSRQQNTVINALDQSKQKAKGKLEPCNKLYSQMKKTNVPLSKQDRNRILSP